jgi:F-type H+-transporting ATPase subunit a
MNTDINSPLSIAIMAMIFIEFWGITTLGVFKYAGKFFNVSSPIKFFVGILEFIAEIARIISFTFRLFGNMLAGEILLLVMTFLAPFLVALPFYGLETFVGVIQAFVFAMLTLVFAVLAVSSHEGHDDEHDDAHGEAAHGDLAAAAAH